MLRYKYGWGSLPHNLLACLALALACAGCATHEAPQPEQLRLDPNASGNNQAAVQNTPLPKPFRVVAESPLEPGWLGGPKRRRPVPGVTVRFAVTHPQRGATFETSRTDTLDVTTDAAGTASAVLRLGDQAGDVMVAALLPDYPEVPAQWFRATGGVQRIGKDLETATGGMIGDFGVRLLNGDGSPVEGVTVYFRTEGAAEGAAVGRSRVLTDAEGRAVTSWKLGKQVRRYYAAVEIDDTRKQIPANERFDVRAIEFKAMAIDKRGMFIVLFGGLALFILGMKHMSEGLQRMADRRLKNILQSVTRNRFLGVAVGAGVTALIQSSSATTVMMVGFVNAGLLTLQQAIGVVFGANIGTTMTAQIIAFKLDALAYPAIAAGLLVNSLARKSSLKALGTAILGFGLLFLGMKTMGGILEPLKHSPEFVNLFHTFDCTPDPGGFVKPGPAIMCIVIGTLTTMLIQSSSATVGLVLVLASQGLITFYTAVPLVLGDNIGTTITAWLASLGANRNAKRTALAHTLFNVVDAVYMYGLLFLPLWAGKPVFLGLIDAITPGEAFAVIPENLARHVANFHTTAKVFNCLIFLPFVPLMVRVCQRVIPVTDADKETILQYLEPNLLNTPSVALQQAIKEVIYMVRKGQNSMNESCELLCDSRAGLAAKIIEREHDIDRLQREITDYLVQLSRQPLTAGESALIPALIHAVNDAERLGDHTESLVALHTLLSEGKHKIPKRALKGLRSFQANLNEQFEAVCVALDTGDPESVDQVIAIEELLTGLMRELTDLHVDRLGSGKYDVQAGVIYLDAIAHLERVGDHLVNIAERAGKIVKVTST